jgi:Mn-dependent DtxR family transcriptional regulator
MRSLGLKKIIDLVKKEKIITSSETARALKVSWNTADSYLKDLLIDGKLIRIKKEGVTLWMKK